MEQEMVLIDVGGKEGKGADGCHVMCSDTLGKQ